MKHNLKKFPIFLLSLFLLLNSGMVSCSSVNANSALSDSPDRVCLSLNVLSRIVQTSISSGKKPPPEALTLCGMNYPEGFVIDPEMRDIILVGRRIRNRPFIFLDDLVVNLRNVWDSKTYPSCSLEPKPEHVLRMKRILETDTKGMDQRKRLVSQLKKTWGPQDVIIDGVPRNSRFAHVMIDADYHMKKVSHGLARIPGISSNLDRLLEEQRKKAIKGRMKTLSTASMSRFWFCMKPGAPVFAEDQGILFITDCPVMVRTESQVMDRKGQLRDGGGDDPIAEAFAAEFSEKFRHATRQVSVYSDLENLFRLNTIFSAMQHRRADRKAGFPLHSFLPNYPYQMNTPMKNSLPGLVNSKELEMEIEQKGRIYRYSSLPVLCGGVNMGVTLKEKQFQKDKKDNLSNLKARILRSRPSSKTLIWKP